MSELTYTALIRQEQEYFHRLEAARHLDPMARIDKGLLTSIRRMEELDPGRLVEFASLCERARVSATPAERIAIRRDCDKVFGYFSYHKAPVPAEICDLFTDRSAPDPYPRANLYEYAFGSDPGRDGHLYTGDDRERALLGVLTESIGLAHRAAHLLIEARGELREHGDSHGSLAAAAEAVQAAAKPMARTYKAVTPQFFRLEMTRRWRHVDIGGVPVQGPNVSHNAHLHVDRLAAGSYDAMTAANPAMAHVYEERQSTMPGFLRRLLRYIDENDGGESIVELSRGSADRAAATMILKTLGKTKVMHKSYADKGLAAAGKALSPDMPDLLTDNIKFVLEPLHRTHGGEPASMSTNLFVNGPIQNSDFSFDGRPHKLVGLRLASILNELGGNRGATDLWNVARLAGDAEYRRLAAAGRANRSRLEYETDKVTRRYREAGETRDFLLDCDPVAIGIAKDLLERGLSKGALELRFDTVPACRDCGHFANSSPVCPSCSSERIATVRTKRLFALRDPAAPVFTSRDMYGGRDAKYVADMSAHRPNPLAMSTRRELGVTLDEFGLPGQVLNPQASLHTAAVAAGIAAGADTVTMLVTPCVGIKIAVYGQHFLDAGACRLRYAFHGRVPYDHVLGSYEPERMDWQGERLFRTWFLPLHSLKSREPISPDQIEPLRRFFRRMLTRRAAESGDPPPRQREEVARQITAGSYRWISDRRLLGGVVPWDRNAGPANQSDKECQGVP